MEVASPPNAHRLRPLSSSLHGPSPSNLGLGPLQTLRVQWTTSAVTLVTVAVRTNASEWSVAGDTPVNDKGHCFRSSILLCLELHGNQVLLATTGPLHQQLPKLGSATWGSSPLCESDSLVGRVLPLWWTSSYFIKWMPFASTVPLSSANGVAIGASPQGECLSPPRGFPSFEGFPSPSEWHSHHGPSPFHNE